MAGVVLEHVHIVERVLGHPLPSGVEVHHVNTIKGDNRNENLVVCQDRAYHMLLHSRMRARRACGHVDWHRCVFCKAWGAPWAVEYVRYWAHRDCRLAYRRARWHQIHGCPEANKSVASKAMWAKQSGDARRAFALDNWERRRTRIAAMSPTALAEHHVNKRASLQKAWATRRRQTAPVA